jgi:hypothetical protein
LGFVRYLASLSTARQILWCYLLWYLFVLVRYFDARPRIWLTSIGLSAIVGFALYLSTAGTSQNTRLGPWQIFRLFLMPFCVSSFAALVKDHDFFLIFSPRWQDLVWGGALVLGFLLLVRLVKRFAPAHSRR